ncbi:hypothetical protein Droror1_Dr00025969 [Drosera rotundifolia]
MNKVRVCSSHLIAGGSPMRFDPRKVPRLGVMPRYAKDDKDMKWFDVQGFNMFHLANGWDEEDGEGRGSVVVVAPNVLSINHGIERIDLFHGRMEMVRIDLGNNGAMTRKALSKDNLEFPVINPAYAGKKNRSVYAMIINDAPRMTGVVKLDLDMAAKNGGYIEECVVARREYEPGCYGEEVSFVAREIKDQNGVDIVASVKLLARVPYGFHGLFIKEKDLRCLM